LLIEFDPDRAFTLQVGSVESIMEILQESRKPSISRSY
jgi:hypothetical protein